MGHQHTPEWHLDNEISHQCVITEHLIPTSGKMNLLLNQPALLLMTAHFHLLAGT